MTQESQTIQIEFDPDRAYIAVTYNNMDVGFCTPEFASRIVETFNESEQLREEKEVLTKALQIACLDLLKRSGKPPNQVNQLVQKYLEKSKRPEHGTRAIAYLLKDRQRELNVSDKEFVFFCNSYRLSPEELRDIYRGKEVTNEQLKVLSRILGKTVQELMEIRDGFSNNEIGMLARILGTSTNELATLLK